MSKIIRCERMKGRKLNTSFGVFAFDSKGEVEVADEDAKKLLTLKGYTQVGEASEEGCDDDENDVKEPQVNSSSTEEEKQQESDASQVKDDEQTGDNSAVTENEDKEPEKEPSTEVADENTDEGIKITVEELESKNVPQLKKIASENGIDLNGATKKNDIIPILIGALSEK